MIAHGSPTTGFVGSACTLAVTVNCGISWIRRWCGKENGHCPRAHNAHTASRAKTTLTLRMEHLHRVMFLN